MILTFKNGGFEDLVTYCVRSILFFPNIESGQCEIHLHVNCFLTDNYLRDKVISLFSFRTKNTRCSH